MHHGEENSTVDVGTLVEGAKTRENVSEETDMIPSERSSLVGLNDAADEFFDVPEPSDNDQSDDSWTSDFGSETYSQVLPIYSCCSS